MRRIMSCALLLLAGGATIVHAQDRPARRVQPAESWVRAGGRIVAPMGLGSLENILRRKDELELTSEQAAQIETMRREEVARRQTEARDLIDLQSRASAGIIDRITFRNEMEKIEDAQRLAARGVRNRLEQILTEEQRSRLPFRFPLEGIRLMSPDGHDFNWFNGLQPSSFNWDTRALLDRLRLRSGGIL